LTEKTYRLLPALSLSTAMLLWGSSFVAIKLAYQGFHPMQVMFGRMLVASLLFIIFIPAFRRINWRRRDLKYLLFMVLCEPCLYYLFEAKALELTSASQAGMISALLPLLIAVMAWTWLKERISRKTLAGFFIGIIGVFWLSLGGRPSLSAPHPLLGNLCEVLAMACAAGYTVALKHLTANYPPLLLTALQAFVGSLFFFPFLLLPGTGLPAAWPLLSSLAIIYLGIFATCGAYGCYNYGISRIPASRAAGFVNLLPVFSVLLGIIILDETLTLWQSLACGLVFCGVWLSSRQPQGRAHELST
jgi:drug/metabolite transporter (DMT)-like permease